MPAGSKTARTHFLSPIKRAIKRPIKRWYHVPAGSKAARTHFEIVPVKADGPFEA